ncbi:MAG: hypothetical protein CMG46_01535 [Candidatus Marinimicrobia bacterium]|nr:hypothetical protein [Candidatus Neomarinimicrobiota bacterium]
MLNKLIILLILSFAFAQVETDSLQSVQFEKDKDTAWKLNMLPIVTGRMSLGQFYNDKPLKAIFLLSMKSYWINEFKLAKEIGDIGDRNRSFWWLFFLYFYGIIDAYVDSHIDDIPEINKNEQKSME